MNDSVLLLTDCSMASRGSSLPCNMGISRNVHTTRHCVTSPLLLNAVSSCGMRKVGAAQATRLPKSRESLATRAAKAARYGEFMVLSPRVAVGLVLLRAQKLRSPCFRVCVRLYLAAP